MASGIRTKLNITGNVYGDKQKFDFAISDYAQTVYDRTFKLNNQDVTSNADALTELIQFNPAGTADLGKANKIIIANTGVQTAEVQVLIHAFDVDDDAISSTTNTKNNKLAMLIHPGDFFVLPHTQMILYNSNVNAVQGGTTAPASAANKATKAFTAVNTNGYNSTTGALNESANFDIFVNDGDALNSTDTTLVIDENGASVLGGNTSDALHRHDLLFNNTNNEVLQVASITDENTIEITRSMTSVAANTINDNTIVHLYFKYNGGVKTDAGGSYYASNFFGLGRNQNELPSGIVPGSVAIKFYEPPFARAKLFNVGPSTNTQLAKNTAYELQVNLDGAGATAVTFTTDASNVLLGTGRIGDTGVLRKLQVALNTAFKASVTKPIVRIVNGDLRIISTSRASNASVAITAGDTGTAEFLGTGIIPAAGSWEATAAYKPSDEDHTRILFDDGKGALTRAAGGGGIINYETGAFWLKNCPPNSSMEYACSYNSALSGLQTSTKDNHLVSVHARSTNQYREATVKILAFNDRITESNQLFLAGAPGDDGGFDQLINPGIGEGLSGATSGGGGGA